MKNVSALMLTSALLFAVSAPGLAQSMNNMKSAPSSMMTPKCAAGDPMVGVNMNTKMYMTRGQMKMKMSGMSKSKQDQMMMRNHVKMMCELKAQAMGAKMMKPH